MSRIQVAGLGAHYVQRRAVPARRPPVLFVHGAGGTHQHWLYQVRDMPEAASFAVDLPGHGASEGPGRDSVAAYADWLVTFLDALGLERAVWVGHSMGGAIALDGALRHPARVAGLGLVATGARLRVAPAILEAIRLDYGAAVRLFCEWTYGPEAPPEMVRRGRLQMAAVPAQVLLDDLLACDAFDVLERVASIVVPAAVVCGTQDRLTAAKFSTYLRDRIPGATLDLVEGAGHMVMLESPARVASALADLLERVGAQPGAPG